MALSPIIIIIAAYLLGSISSAVLISRIFSLNDPRKEGSKNPGATNVYRLGGAVPAALVLLCDVLKGALPVLLGLELGFQSLAIAAIGVSACLGHMYPAFFHFVGGKGVATALGVLLPLSLTLCLALIITWTVVLKLRGYSSLAALVTVVSAPFYCYLFAPEHLSTVILLCALVFWRHHSNIERLRNHTESSIVKKRD
ncbi:glycerol-3-phosphate 1-O-acyltransferase [Alginatibacterium sediminis]|uniref:Glycerol-3-phosphate acyltransferase n=1 Tax=Alginatibacterium sediminis TaxID=2164068 RepID=A0A420ECP2_9ALTE|nr:glycerol-3-phosphate 1-O-acyltransferase PlsY [Alginatibacterium sediminis]RKF18435.1 glycerol-3-phosphate 1-O-acyltransferase [Alginatibacterium sediminis]